MKTKTTQVLIYISQTYTAKNKLQNLAINKIRKLNFIMCNNIDHAKELLMEELRSAHNECKTNCTPLKFQPFQSSISEWEDYSIPGLIQIKLLPVYREKKLS